jgi:hypothetical protein
MSVPMAGAVALLCAGFAREGPLGLALPEAAGTPVAVTFRIDLAARRWCRDACAATEAIAGESDGVLILREIHGLGGSQVVMLSPALDYFSDTRIEGDRATLLSGRCKRVGEGAAAGEIAAAGGPPGFPAPRG